MGGVGAYEVQVALIAALALIVAAAIPSIISVVVLRWIGKPNGRGNLNEMVGTALDEAAEAKELAAQAVATNAENHAASERRNDAQDESLERIELALRAALMDRGIAEPDGG